MAVTSTVQKEDILFDLIDKSTAVLERESGLDHEAAHAAACSIASEVAKDWGGMQIYFPKGLSLRDIKIFQEFTGNNHTELARKYNLTEVRVYQILEKARESYIKKTQPDLFSNESTKNT